VIYQYTTVNTEKSDSPIALAIFHVGSVSKLAASIGVRSSAISNWQVRGTIPKPIYCLAIERATNGAVTRRDLRPDDWHLIWPELAAAAPAVQDAPHHPDQESV